MAVKDVRFAALLAALLLYAIFGTPTPDRPGWTELAVGLLLVAATGLRPLLALFVTIKLELWRRAGWALLLYGLSLPVLAGLMMGNGLWPMARDMVPFLFFLLPLFLAPVSPASFAAPGRDHYRHYLTVAIAGLGLVLAARVIAALPGQQGALFELEHAAIDPYYLANSPVVLMAGLLLIGLAGSSLYRAVSAKTLLQSGILLLLAALPLAAMALVSQRASFAYGAAALLLLLAVAAVKNPVRAAAPILAGLALLAACWPLLAEFGAALAHKNMLVGVNMRGQELQAVIAAFDGAWAAVLFGKGWGAAFSSPAVGGVSVNFTHSLLSAMWLKTGLIGLVLSVFYLGALAAGLWRLLGRFPVLALALAGPLLINILFYASYKSLDFGLLLLLIALWGRHGDYSSEKTADLLRRCGGCSIEKAPPT